MEDYHTETMKDDPLWGAKYEEFVQEYANCYSCGCSLHRTIKAIIHCSKASTTEKKTKGS
jgi:hypothetical protein